VVAGLPHQRREEFEEVALPHFDALFNLALNLTRNRKDAEDLVQEAYLKAYRFFGSYRPGTQIKAWLFRILRNTFINRYRARKLRPTEVDFGKIESSYEEMIQEQFLREHRPASPEQSLLDNLLDEEVEAALQELPEEYRTVVWMALAQDLSYKEIAASLSIPIGTVMSRLHRGRKLLQATLLDYASRKGIVRTPQDVASDEGPRR
jgi:RNA polymerase sigma-70 factor (ECF subfamily)